VTVCTPEAEILGLRLAADPGRDLRVEGDIGRLSLALRCLLESAMRHSEEGSQIEISARRHTEDGRRWMEYEVAHRGQSSEAMQLDRRLDDEAAPFTPGVGLGLTIVRQVLAEHGGHAEARALPWGGAQVFLRLPVD
jgi:signal transduction histidine kinase